jgi:site-specific DNA-methyltransferase (adenine-specific)
MKMKTNMEQHLFNGDSAEVLKTLKDNSVDLLATDPPYGIEFMGKSWDKVLPPTNIWQECYRVLKPGSFIAVMSSPRSDVLYRMIKDLEDAGFDMSFSPIMWTYHSGFPKASDTSKMIDKRGGTYVKDLGVMLKEARETRGLSLNDVAIHFPSKTGGVTGCVWNWESGTNYPTIEQVNQLIEILDLDISKVEKVYGNIIGKKVSGIGKAFTKEGWGTGSDEVDIVEPATDLAKKYEGSKLGFQPKPAVEHIIIGMKPHGSKSYIDNVLNFEALPDNIKMTYPFIQVPKPAKKEKDLGMMGEGKKETMFANENGEKQLGRATLPGNEHQPKEVQPKKNIHPTTKPVKLMSYIITLFTREGDWVIDPFLGSGTTGIASKLLNRQFIGIEREKEYFDICEERLSVSRDELINFFKK